jgi:hypothetical protein
MIEHLVQQLFIILRGRSLFLLVYIVRVYVYKQTECVIGLVSLRKKKEAIREEDQVFCNETCLLLVFYYYYYLYDYVIGTRMT